MDAAVGAAVWGSSMSDPIQVAPDVFDPDTPTEAVGTLRLPNPEAFGLSWPVLAFVAGAVIVAFLRLDTFRSTLNDPVPWLMFAIVSIATVLLPAALLLRVHDAARTHSVLLGGLAVGSILVVLRAVATSEPVLGSEAMTTWRGLLDVIMRVSAIVGTVLVGLGLLRLSPATVGRVRRIAVVAVIYVAVTYVPLLITLTIGQIEVTDPLGSLVLPGVGVAATGFTTGVAVVAWFDRAEPRRFWGLLATAMLVYVAFSVLSAVWWLGFLRPSPGGQSVVYGIFAFAEALVACLALVAYLRYTPVAAAGREPGSLV